MEERIVEDGSPTLKKRYIRNDFILVGVILAVALAVFAVFFLFGEEGGYATVILDGEMIGEYSLYEDREIELVTGENGEYYNILVISSGEAYVREANCPDGICSDHRPIRKVGDTIVCLPHKLVIRIDGKNDSGVDI